MQVIIKLQVSDQLCKDFLTACCESGSNYWLACDSIKRDSDRNVIKIVGCCDREADVDASTWGDATIETIRVGVVRILEGNVKVRDDILGRILCACIDADYSGWDAETADCVLQAGLLNSIVYG